MMDNLTKIKNQKDRMREEQVLCILCLGRRKNIVILGCNHQDICDICEKELRPKKCPNSRNQYENVIKVFN